MPHSTHHPLTTVMEHVNRMAPSTVLDIGVGYGKWGFLIRESLDWMQDRHERSQWKTTIDGLEAFAGYSTPMYEWVYNRVSYGDITKVVDDLPAYDLVMMGDVIEHLEKEEGLRVLRALLGKSKNVIVSTPVDFFTQEALDNPFEAHLSLWALEDFREWVFDYSVEGHTAVVVALAGKSATYPTLKDRRASEAAYRLPAMRAQGVAARLIKRVVWRLSRD